MDLILDTSILIASERRRGSLPLILREIRTAYGEVEASLSAISVVELTHGIYRARTPEDRERRRTFTEEVFAGLLTHPVSFQIAHLAGRIEGEQAALGNNIPFEDLLIGATALQLGFAVATLNLKHFQQIPGLQVVSL